MEKEIYLNELKKKLESERLSHDFINKCLKYASRLLDNGVPVIFDYEHFAALLGLTTSNLVGIVFSKEKNYKTVEIPKKNGDKRRIDIPNVTLKYVQRWILDNILNCIPVSDFAFGFRSGFSILDNALMHTNQQCVINIDIEGFFPSITFKQVFRLFNYYGYTRQMSFVLAQLCTYQGYLPQGAPTSPYISNVVCKKLDARLEGLAKSYNANYSRYADDITFSGEKGVDAILPIVKEVLASEGFKINKRKTHISYKHQRQEVTGLIVNGSTPRVSQSYKRKFKQELYYCKKYGVSNHMQYIQCDKAFYKDHMVGKALFIYMIEPIVGESLLNELSQIDWEK